MMEMNYLHNWPEASVLDNAPLFHQIGRYKGPMAVPSRKIYTPMHRWRDDLAILAIGVAMAAATLYITPKTHSIDANQVSSEIIMPAQVMPKHLEYKGIDLEAMIRQEVAAIMNNHERIADYSERFSKTSAFRDYIRKGADEQGVDYNLCFAIIAQESSGDLDAASGGSLGLQQLKPSAAREMGVKMNRFEDYRGHPSSTPQGIGYFERYDVCHNPILALFAYNRGCIKVQASLQNTWLYRDYSMADLVHVSMPNFPDDIWQAQSDEARAHVIRVYALKYLLDQGFKYEEKPLWSDKLKNATPIKVADGKGIYRIAQEHDVTVEQIKEINPQIRDIHKVAVGQTIYVPN